jgi:hypothetical protein
MTNKYVLTQAYGANVDLLGHEAAVIVAGRQPDLASQLKEIYSKPKGERSYIIGDDNPEYSRMRFGDGMALFFSEDSRLLKLPNLDEIMQNARSNKTGYFFKDKEEYHRCIDLIWEEIKGCANPYVKEGLMDLEGAGLICAGLIGPRHSGWGTPIVSSYKIKDEKLVRVSNAKIHSAATPSEYSAGNIQRITSKTDTPFRLGDNTWKLSYPVSIKKEGRFPKNAEFLPTMDLFVQQARILIETDCKEHGLFKGNADVVLLSSDLSPEGINSFSYYNNCPNLGWMGASNNLEKTQKADEYVRGFISSLERDVMEAYHSGDWLKGETVFRVCLPGLQEIMMQIFQWTGYSWFYNGLERKSSFDGSTVVDRTKEMLLPGNYARRENTTIDDTLDVINYVKEGLKRVNDRVHGRSKGGG